MPRRIQSAETLRAMSKHVASELRMLQQTCDLARQEPDSTARRAFIEAWTVHARNLLDFYYFQHEVKTARKDDALAEDYFPESAIWRDNRPSPSRYLATLSRRVSKEIAHLTYERANFGSVGPSWPMSRITNEFRDVTLRFYELAPRETIGSEFRRFFNIEN